MKSLILIRFACPFVSSRQIVGGIVAFAGVGFLFPFAYMHYNLVRAHLCSAEICGETEGSVAEMLTRCLLVFVVVGVAFWCVQESGNHYTSSKALSPNQVQRGAFLNSGTHDVGPDLSWHARHGITQREGAAVERQRAEERKKQAQKAQA